MKQSKSTVTGQLDMPEPVQAGGSIKQASSKFVNSPVPPNKGAAWGKSYQGADLLFPRFDGSQPFDSSVVPNPKVGT